MIALSTVIFTVGCLVLCLIQPLSCIDVVAPAASRWRVALPQRIGAVCIMDDCVLLHASHASSL